MGQNTGVADIPQQQQEPIERVPDNLAYDHHAELEKAMELIEPVEAPAAEPEGADVKASASEPQEQTPEVAQESEAQASDSEPHEAEEPQTASAKSWAALMRKEREFNQQKQELKSELALLRREREEFAAEREQQSKVSSNIKTKFSKDPFGTLQNEFGVNFQQLAEMALSDNYNVLQQKQASEKQQNIEKTLLDKIEQLEQRLTQRDAEQGMNVYRSDVRTVLGSDEFSLLSTLPNAEEEIINYAGAYAQQYQEVLPAKDAAAKILDTYRSHLRSTLSNKQVRELLGLPDPEQSSAPTSESSKAPRKPQRTLTNSMKTAPPRSPAEPLEFHSEQEELMAAAKLIPEDVWDHME